MLQVNKFSVATPDEDGNMLVMSSATMTNSSQETVDQIRYSAVFLDANGGPAGFAMTTPDDCTVPPGESVDISPNGYVGSSASAGGRDDLTLLINANLLVKRTFDLGQFKSPTLENPVCSTVTKATDSSLISDIHLSVSIVEFDDPKECDLALRALLKSESAQIYEDAEVEFVICNEFGEEVFRDTVRSNIPSNGLGMFEGSLYGIKKKELTEGQVTATLCVFDEVAGSSAQARSTAED